MLKYYFKISLIFLYYLGSVTPFNDDVHADYVDFPTDLRKQLTKMVEWRCRNPFHEAMLFPGLRTFKAKIPKQSLHLKTFATSSSSPVLNVGTVLDRNLDDLIFLVCKNRQFSCPLNQNIMMRACL